MSSLPPSPPGNQFSAEPPPKKSGSGWKIFGIGCGIVLLICCGGIVTTSYFGYRTFANAFTEDPAKIQETADSVAEIQVPEGFKPTLAIDFDLPPWAAGGFEMHCAIFDSADAEALLVLANIKIDDGQLNPEDVKAQIEQQMKQQGKQREQQIEYSGEIEERELTIRGEPAKFTFRKGKKAGSDVEYLETFGSFKGNDGATGLFWLRAPIEEISVDEAAALAESIK